MKRLHFAVGLLTALACTGLEAQTPLRANIPFDFQVGKASFPSGDYVFEPSGHILIVRQAGGQQSGAMALTQSTWRTTRSKTSVLEFNRYGDTYFLAQLWIQGSMDGESLPKTAREREVARLMPSIQRETLALQTK